MATKRWELYVLKCEHKKYYVGITSKGVENRYEEHATGIGAEYTRRHKPLEIIETKDLGRVAKRKAEIVEDETAKKYRKEFGRFNVSGGHLSIDQYMHLKTVDGIQSFFRLIWQVYDITKRLVRGENPKWSDYESINYREMISWLTYFVVWGVIIYLVLNSLLSN